MNQIHAVVLGFGGFAKVLEILGCVQLVAVKIVRFSLFGQFRISVTHDGGFNFIFDNSDCLIAFIITLV